MNTEAEIAAVEKFASSGIRSMEAWLAMIPENRRVLVLPMVSMILSTLAEGQRSEVLDRWVQLFSQCALHGADPGEALHIPKRKGRPSEHGSRYMTVAAMIADLKRHGLSENDAKKLAARKIRLAGFDLSPDDSWDTDARTARKHVQTAIDDGYVAQIEAAEGTSPGTLNDWLPPGW